MGGPTRPGPRGTARGVGAFTDNGKEGSKAMSHHIRAALGALVLAGAPALAQEAADPAVLEEGQAIYATQCAICHQANGSGRTPAFPAMAGNPNLEDTGFIAVMVRGGGANMPPHPAMSVEEIAAVATYVRTSFGNGFGPAPVEEVAAALEGWEPGEVVSVWDGVYSRAQAERGQMMVLSACAECHGERLDGASLDPDRPGAPAIARARFLRNWEGRSLATLFDFTRATMPPASPGFLSDEQYMEVIARMLAVSNIPAGSEDLVADREALAGIELRQEE